MSKNLLVVGIVVAVLLVGGMLVLQKPAGQPAPTETEDAVDAKDEGVTETEEGAKMEGETAVTMANFAFDQKTVTVKKGTKVTWTNKDLASHTVTSDTGSELSSELLGQGESFSHVFSTAGTYAYHCTPHPNMKATVVVEE